MGWFPESVFRGVPVLTRAAALVGTGIGGAIPEDIRVNMNLLRAKLTAHPSLIYTYGECNALTRSGQRLGAIALLARTHRSWLGRRSTDRIDLLTETRCHLTLIMPEDEVQSLPEPIDPEVEEILVWAARGQRTATDEEARYLIAAFRHPRAWNLTNVKLSLVPIEKVSEQREAVLRLSGAERGDDRGSRLRCKMPFTVVDLPGRTIPRLAS